MPDREKVIKGLYACTTFGEDGVTDGDCKFCPYGKGYATGECWVQMNRDALALLKEQEAVKPRVSSVEQRCGNCNKVIEMDGWKACPWCGKPILWEGR